MRYEHYKACKLLIKNGCELNALNALRDTPLNIAISKCNVKMVNLLLEHGAKKDIRNASGYLPFDIAATKCEDTKSGDSYLILKSLKVLLIIKILLISIFLE